jgi:hypothetical protein
VDNNEILSGQISKTIYKGIGTLSRDFSISFLDNCIVYLCDKIGAMRINNLNQCKIYAGPVITSILIENCNNCTFSLASQQVISKQLY